MPELSTFGLIQRVCTLYNTATEQVIAPWRAAKDVFAYTQVKPVDHCSLDPLKPLPGAWGIIATYCAVDTSGNESKDYEIEFVIGKDHTGLMVFLIKRITVLASFVKPDLIGPDIVNVSDELNSFLWDALVAMEKQLKRKEGLEP